MKQIVVVGSMNMDLVIQAPSIARAGETLLGSDFQTYPGGKGANQAVAVGRLGYPVAMIGKVGDDAFGEQLRANLVKNGVDVEAVAIADAPSGVALITVANSGENSIVVGPGANELVTPEFIDQNADLLRSAGLVLVQLETPVDAIMRVAEICSSAQVPLMLDPAPARELPEALFQHVTWFTPNDTEVLFYLNSKNLNAKDADSRTAEPAAAETEPEILADRILSLGLKGVILKRGSRGSYLSDRLGSGTLIPSFKVKAIDTTAAGDSWNGAFAVGLMRGLEPAASARFASAAAAIAVTRRGAQASMATEDEVQALLKEQ